MATTTQSGMVHFSFPILEKKLTPEGDLIVYGKCTDGTVDADHQIVDPKWSGKALEDWLESGGNMRVQHSPFLYPAGKGLALEINKTGKGDHWLQAMVASDTPAFGLVQKGVLRDFSIGILDPRLSYRNPAAPEGTIVGGRVGEVSLVDRGSNKNSGFTIAKAGPDGNPELVYRLYFEGSPADMARVLNKKKKRIVDSGGTDRTDTPKDQFAGPHNSFPVEGPKDVSDAASLAHHAADPAQVRSRIRSIATHDLGMSQDKLPPSLKSANCTLCAGSGKIRNGQMDCPDCEGSGKMVAKMAQPDPDHTHDDVCKCDDKGAIMKGDGGQDNPGDVGADEQSETDYNAEADANDADDEGADSINPPKRMKKNKSRPRRGRRDPAAVAGGAKAKTATPAPLPAGTVDHEVAGSTWAGKATGSTTTAPYSMIALHQATCPAVKRSAFKSLGYGSILDAIPVSEFSECAQIAIQKGDLDVADYYLGLVRAYNSVTDFGDPVLNEARKYANNGWGNSLFPEARPDSVGDVAPSQFTGRYLNSGHPAPTAAGYKDDGIPGAPHHHVDAAQFTRTYIKDGRPDVLSPGSTGQTTRFDQAVMGQAMNAMARFHLHASTLWPDLCQAKIEQRNYTNGDGATGLSASRRPQFPTAPGESGLLATRFNKADADEAPEADAGAIQMRGAISKMERAIRKQNKVIARQRAELDQIGAQPDPRRAAFRGIPMADGPVDRFSHIDKALGPAGEDDSDDFRDYLKNLTRSGNPTLRQAATDQLRTLLTAD